METPLKDKITQILTNTAKVLDELERGGTDAEYKSIVAKYIALCDIGALFGIQTNISFVTHVITGSQKMYGGTGVFDNIIGALKSLAEFFFGAHRVGPANTTYVQPTVTFTPVYQPPSPPPSLQETPTPFDFIQELYNAQNLPIVENQITYPTHALPALDPVPAPAVAAVVPAMASSQAIIKKNMNQVAMSASVATMPIVTLEHILNNYKPSYYGWHAQIAKMNPKMPLDKYINYVLLNSARVIRSAVESVATDGVFFGLGQTSDAVEGASVILNAIKNYNNRPNETKIVIRPAVMEDLSGALSEVLDLDGLLQEELHNIAKDQDTKDYFQEDDEDQYWPDDDSTTDKSSKDGQHEAFQSAVMDSYEELRKYVDKTFSTMDTIENNQYKFAKVIVDYNGEQLKPAHEAAVITSNANCVKYWLKQAEAIAGPKPSIDSIVFKLDDRFLVMAFNGMEEFINKNNSLLKQAEQAKQKKEKETIKAVNAKLDITQTPLGATQTVYIEKGRSVSVSTFGRYGYWKDPVDISAYLYKHISLYKHEMIVIYKDGKSTSKFVSQRRFRPPTSADDARDFVVNTIGSMVRMRKAAEKAKKATPGGKKGGSHKVRVLGRDRVLYKKGRMEYIKFKGAFITLKVAKNMDKNKRSLARKN